jgi:hypothetical protein
LPFTFQRMEAVTQAVWNNGDLLSGDTLRDLGILDSTTGSLKRKFTNYSMEAVTQAVIQMDRIVLYVSTFDQIEITSGN